MSDAPLEGEVLPADWDPSQLDHRDYADGEGELTVDLSAPHGLHPGRTNHGRFAPGNVPSHVGQPDMFYNPGVVGRLLARIALGTPLTKICKDKDMPSTRLVNRWVQNYPEFKMAYEAAREEGFDEIAEETLKIADEVAEDRDAIGKAALRIKTRHHLLGCWSPRYSPKQTHDVSGSFTVKIGAEDSKL